ncbi:MAG: hypothetical protein KGQ46_01830 [Hyphomicrobiales bacterium]|nr:hypothetical protein [Hyphomicrobiales bacterium]MDE2115690.1 hypothetical protein [Hyphomicrobiales bacterium]
MMPRLPAFNRWWPQAMAKALSSPGLPAQIGHVIPMQPFPCAKPGSARQIASRKEGRAMQNSCARPPRFLVLAIRLAIIFDGSIQNPEPWYSGKTWLN